MILQQRFVQVDGMIIRMDFLKSSNNDPNRVVLLLIVANQGVTRLLLYKWDSTRSLSTLRPSQRSGHQLPKTDSFPHLLIPSCRNSSFAIVVGQFIVFYDDVETKNLRRLEANLEIEPDDTDKHWVQWAKPIRLEEYRKQKEDIYIIREDGLLRTILGSHNLSKRISATVRPGYLNINVDTAVCALSAPPTAGGDILIVCGDTTEGGVFHIAARTAPRLLQILPNWSPINDFVHMEQSSAGSEQASIVAATGIHDGRSALTELRYGMQADMIWTSNYSEARSIDRIWALEQRSENQLMLLASHHEHTSVLIYNIDSGEISEVDASVFDHLCFDEQTLAAAITPQDITIQIARNSINTSRPHRGSQSCVQSRVAEELICADIHQQTGIWAAIGREADTTLLVGGGTQIDETGAIETSEVPNPLQIAAIPIALSLTIIGGHLLCLVAVQDGGLELYSVHPEDGFRQQSTWTLSELDATLVQPQISAMALLCFPDATSALLVCGLKTGMVIFLALKLVDDGVNVSASLQIERTMSLGATAVDLRNEATIFLEIERAAQIICGSSLFRLILHKNFAGLDFTINQIFIADRELSAPSSALITAVDRVGRFPRAASSSENDPSGALVVVSGEDLSMLTLGPPTMIPRHIRSTGTTRHLVYSPHLNKYIVSHQTRMFKSNPKAKSPQMERPSLMLIDTKSSPAGDDLTLQRTRFLFGDKNEKVRVLMHWTPADDTSHYNMIVIGSDLDKDGRVSYMNESKMNQAKSSPSAKLIATYPKKSISAICAYGMSSLVVCAGRELKILHLDLANRRWTPRGDFELPSRATELTTKGSVIYVATSLHSFLLIRERDGKLDLVGSDQWASRARNIVTYGSNSTLINLVSDHGSRILNFTDRPTQGSKPMSEARLPQAIDKMAHLRLSTTSDSRKRFLGTTMDGTVYLFSTLTEPEMRLMRFLEQLCEPMRLRIAKNASRLAQSIANKYAKKLESTDIAAPVLVETHARGDVLKALLVQGPYNIRFLLQKRAKLEDGMVKHEDEVDELIDLAEPVIGKVDDVVDGVILWLRRTLNVPAF